MCIVQLFLLLRYENKIEFEVDIYLRLKLSDDEKKN